MHGMNWRKVYSREDMWPSLDSIYAHQYDDGVPHFNLIYLMGQTLLPNLVFQAPGIINTPTVSGMTQWAAMFDSIDNWWVEKSEMKDIAFEMVLNAYLHNTSAASIGYNFGSPTEGIENDMREIEGGVDRTQSMNAPWVDSIPSHRLLLAPGTKTMRTCPWAAKFVSTPTRLLKGRGLKNVASSPVPDEIMKHEAQLWAHRDPSQYTCFWEIHDAETKKWCWLSTSGKFLLPWDEDPLQVMGLPFEVLSMNPNGKSLWGTPDPVYIMSQHLEGDDVRYQAMKQRRISVPKFLYNSSALDVEDVNRLMSANSPAAIPVNLEMDQKIGDKILQLTPSVNFGLQEYSKFLMTDAQHISGVGPNQMGNYAPGRRSAKEAGIVEGVSSTRVTNRRALVASAMEGLVNKANRLITDNWTEDIVQQVVGADGALYWVSADPKELARKGFGISTKVNVESMAPVSRESRKKEAAELLNMLGTMQESGANTMPILKQFLSQFEWVDVRQVLPQQQGQMTMPEFEAQQNGMINAGGVGQQAAENLQGVNALMQRLPSEGAPNEPQQEQE